MRFAISWKRKDGLGLGTLYVEKKTEEDARNFFENFMEGKADITEVSPCQ